MESCENWYYAVLTNGEIDCRLKAGRYNVGIDLPDGVVFGQDNDGNMYLNGKKAWITYRKDGEMA